MTDRWCYAACEHFEEERVDLPEFESYELKPKCLAGETIPVVGYRRNCKVFLREGVFPINDILKHGR